LRRPNVCVLAHQELLSGRPRLGALSIRTGMATAAMSTTRAQGTLGDELTNLGIALLIGAAAFALLLRAAGTVAAWATGIAQPASGPESGLSVLLNPGNPSAALHAPGLNPFAYWAAA